MSADAGAEAVTQTPAWTIRVAVPEAAVEVFSEALRPFALSVVSFTERLDGDWAVEAYAAVPPAPAPLATAIALASAAAGMAQPDLTCAPFAARDWLADSLESFKPLRVGPFFLAPSHSRDAPPVGSIPIRLDAATAFGTGEHGSTKGCLLALHRLSGRLAKPRVLDLGSGSGVLSMAAAKLWHGRVYAADIDAEAVRVSRENFSANGLAMMPDPIRCNGFGDRRLREAAPFDLIAANILARPLMALAGNVRAHLRRPGYAVLSGLLIAQEGPVLNAYARVGFRPVDRIAVDGWRTLVLRRDGRARRGG